VDTSDLSNLAGIQVSSDRMSSALADGELTGASTSQERYAKWRKPQKFPPEYLLPHITRQITREWPRYMSAPGGGHPDLDEDALRARVKALDPWYLPFRIRDDYFTMNMKGRQAIEATSRVLFRRDLIVGTVAAILGDEIAETTVLDIGCNCGFFSLDIADRGAKHVDGIDLRPENIAQAQFLADNYRLDNVIFRVSDADALPTEKQRDVVFNLGVLYHVVNPLQFIRQTYELCRRFAIIDTVVHSEPVSAYILFGDKNVDHPAEGREEWEFHPTYRGAIDTIRYAGFSHVIEILGDADPPHPLYGNGSRRCFLAIK
jgi:tRNA (mo5U34)-methyltransferase